MAILGRGARNRRIKKKPDYVTGSFELHYEDVIHKNRFALVGLFTGALVLMAAFIPNTVYHSTADTDRISIEAEAGLLINPELIIKVEGDATASEDSFIEFRLNPAGQEE